MLLDIIVPALFDISGCANDFGKASPASEHTRWGRILKTDTEVGMQEDLHFNFPFSPFSSLYLWISLLLVTQYSRLIYSLIYVMDTQAEDAFYNFLCLSCNGMKIITTVKQHGLPMPYIEYTHKREREEKQ